jgi:hypothetical protein
MAVIQCSADIFGAHSREANMKYTVALIALACSASFALADIRIENPRVNKRPLDWCLVPAKQCGKPAADAYCKLRNMGHAVRFTGQRSGEPTFILGTREICDLRRFDHCDRFSAIVCSAVRID